MKIRPFGLKLPSGSPSPNSSLLQDPSPPTTPEWPASWPQESSVASLHPTISPEEKLLLQEIRSLYEHHLHRGQVLNQEDFFHHAHAHFRNVLRRSLPEELLVFWWEQVHQFKALDLTQSQQEITEVLFHGHDLTQLEINGRLIPGPAFPLGQEDFQLALEVLCLQQHINWNYSAPFASFTFQRQGLPHRATLIHHSLTPQGVSKCFLRKFPQSPLPLSSFQLQERDMKQLKNIMEQKKNILICGATSSGKTSLLSSLLESYIPPTEHVLILEDTHEIISTFPSRTHLLGKGKIKQGHQHQEERPLPTLVELCSYALRLRPDRLILGEIRGEEVIPLFLNLNTGHRGFLATIHANSAPEALDRVGLLMGLLGPSQSINYALSMELIARNVDVVIYMEKRRVKQMVKVLGADQGKCFIDEL